MVSTTAGDEGVMCRWRVWRGFGTAAAGLEGRRPHSTARRSTPCRRVSVLRIEAGPTPAASSSTRIAPHCLRGEVAQLQPSETREHVHVPQRRVELQRLGREIRRGVELPPLLSELGEGLLAGVEEAELAGALHAPHLSIEGLGVALAAEDLAAVASLFVSAPPIVGFPGFLTGLRAVENAMSSHYVAVDQRLQSFGLAVAAVLAGIDRQRERHGRVPHLRMTYGGVSPIENSGDA